MNTFPNPGKLPALEGFTCRQLAEPDAQAIMALQTAMLAALPSPTWYYPSPRALFAACCARGEAFGFFSGARLAGFAVLTPWHVRPDACYAHKVGDPPENTYDFQDVMVHPDFRRRGIHAALLSLFDRLAREAGGTALYCTIAPENLPSVASFQKAGYTCVRVQPAYEGMLRGYYRKALAAHV
jgi:GNAT superfamily N-acetyltransferase